MTLLLGDVEGSVRLWEADRVAMKSVASRLSELVSESIAKHDGVRPVEQGEGDSFVAAFARASDAVGCAIAIQTATRDEPWPGEVAPRYRMALHTGEAQFRDEGNYAGAFINRCARLRDIGHGGQILVSRATHDLAVDSLRDDIALVPLGAHRLRDLARPEDVFQVSDPAQPTEFPPLRSLDAMPNNLPVQVTSFIGREAEMDQIRRLLDVNRLITLTGAGGSGKTRLAAQVAADLLDRFGDGVWWVDLAPVADPGLVAGTVASVLSVTETAFQPLMNAIAARLRDKNVLVILDNCEHLVAACAELVTGLMQACPAVVLLATSREPLGIEGEVSWRVPSLTLPQANDARGIASLTQYEAVRLFVDRALRARPNFSVSNENAPAVAEICHRLDGIPLAIELAAARVRLLTPNQIAEGLSDRFRLLTGGSRTAMPRQQTLEASVDWSFDLLGDEERRLLARLSVFAGSFTLDAAEAVCSGERIELAQVLDVLSRLVDRSLVQVEDAQPIARYRLLETIRQYGRRKLAASGEADSLRDRHLEYFVEWAGPAEPNWGPGRVLEAIDRHDVEIENIRAALDWAEASQRTDEALRLCSTLAWLWWLRRGPEGKRRLDVVLAMPGGDPFVRASVVRTSSFACWTLGDFITGRGIAEEAVIEARDIGDERLLGRALVICGWHSFISGQPAAVGLLQQGVDLLPTDDDYQPLAEAGLGGARFMGGDWPGARRQLQIVVDRLRSRSGWTPSLAQMWLGVVATYQGDFDEAERVLDETLRFEAEGGEFNPTIGFARAYQGLIGAWRGRTDEGVEAIDRAMFIGEQSGAPWVGWVAEWHRGFVEYGRGEHGAARAVLEEALPFLRAFNERTTGLGCLALLTETARIMGDIDAARGLAAELEAITPASRNGPMAALGALAGAALATVDGRLEAADDLAHGALAEFARVGGQSFTIEALELVGGCAARLESYNEAARLLGAAQAARELLDYRFRWAPDLYASALDSMIQALGDEGYDAAWAEGSAMSLEEAVAYAERGRGERKRPSAGWASLTPTELDVVRLVAEGLTNKQIGERLFIAASTVKVHVSHIFGKLGISTRSELAAQATRRQL